ncbi:MAG: hypothetical protein IPP74_03490 [Alphaproteobacteria bacterium]|nr:hypothetical protein [Alphaproteobacteria bacterium]
MKNLIENDQQIIYGTDSDIMAALKAHESRVNNSDKNSDSDKASKTTLTKELKSIIKSKLNKTNDEYSRSKHPILNKLSLAPNRGLRSFVGKGVPLQVTPDTLTNNYRFGFLAKAKYSQHGGANLKTAIRIDTDKKIGKTLYPGNAFTLDVETNKSQSYVISSAPFLTGKNKYKNYVKAVLAGTTETNVAHISMKELDYRKMVNFPKENVTVKVNGETYTLREKQDANKEQYHEQIKEPQFKKPSITDLSIKHKVETQISGSYSHKFGDTPSEMIYVKKMEIINSKNEVVKNIDYAFYPDYLDDRKEAYKSSKQLPVLQFFQSIENNPESKDKPYAFWANCRNGINRGPSMMADHIAYKNINGYFNAIVNDDILSYEAKTTKIKNAYNNFTLKSDIMAHRIMSEIGIQSMSPKISQIRKRENGIHTFTQADDISKFIKLASGTLKDNYLNKINEEKLAAKKEVELAAQKEPKTTIQALPNAEQSVKSPQRTQEQKNRLVDLLKDAKLADDGSIQLEVKPQYLEVKPQYSDYLEKMRFFKDFFKQAIDNKNILIDGDVSPEFAIKISVHPECNEANKAKLTQQLGKMLSIAHERAASDTQSVGGSLATQGRAR